MPERALIQQEGVRIAGIINMVLAKYNDMRRVRAAARAMQRELRQVLAETMGQREARKLIEEDLAEMDDLTLSEDRGDSREEEKKRDTAA